MNRNQRKRYLNKLVKQHTIPFSFYQAYYNTIGKKNYETRFICLKNKFEAYSINKNWTGKLKIVLVVNQKRSIRKQE